MDLGRVTLVGIAGPSCAGKGTLSRWLAERLGAEVLPIDAYYFPLDHLTVEERARVNFDHPSSMDHALLQRHLQMLRQGKAVERPVYNFARHTREPDTVTVAPAPVVLVEGLFALYWPEVRALLDAAIYIGADNHVCLERRVRRDTEERGRSSESVHEQYNDTVEPMRERFIEPTAAFAGLVLDGRTPVEENGRRAESFLRALMTPSNP